MGLKYYYVFLDNINCFILTKNSTFRINTAVLLLDVHLNYCIGIIDWFYLDFGLQIFLQNKIVAPCKVFIVIETYL